MTQQFKTRTLRDLEELMDRLPEDVEHAVTSTDSVSARKPFEGGSLVEPGLTASQLIERIRAMQSGLEAVRQRDREAAERMEREAEVYDELRAGASRVEANLHFARVELGRAERLLAEALTDEARAEYELYAALCSDAAEKTAGALEEAREAIARFEAEHDVERLLETRRRLREGERRGVEAARAGRNTLNARVAVELAQGQLNRIPTEAIGGLVSLDMEGVDPDVARQVYALFTKAAARAYEGALIASFGGYRAAVVRPAHGGYEVLASLGLGEAYAPGSMVTEGSCRRPRPLRA